MSELQTNDNTAVPEELELQAGLLAKAMMQQPPMSQEEIEEKWRAR